MPRFDAVLFDFDGVLVDSTPIHLDGWDEAFGEYFQRTIDDELRASLPGQSTAAIATVLAEYGGRLELKGELMKRKARYVLDHLADIPLIEGAAEFLELLRSRNIPYSVASNAPRGFIEQAIQRHGLPIPFFLGLEDYSKPKPDPEPYLKGAQLIKWALPTRERIAVFEDSAHGIHAAVAAGMTPIGISSQHPPALLKDAGAQYCLRDFREKEFLEENFLLD